MIPRKVRACLAVAFMLAAPSESLAMTESAQPGVRAYLDGRPIQVSEVARYHCDDFAYPEIRCSSSRLVADARVLAVSLLAAVEYVTIYDYTNYQGGSMSISADYGTLLTIGWNDRASSFKVRNGETGTFFTDWFNGGSSWSFCCNTQQASLGGYNNTFSSVKRT